MKWLKEWQKSVASELAKDLVEYGLLTGEELKEYLIMGVDKQFAFKSEEHYIEFEECVIDFIEKKRRKIKITDITNGDVQYVYTGKEASDILGVTVYRVSAAINKKYLVGKRYIVEYEKIPIKELIKN